MMYQIISQRLLHALSLPVVWKSPDAICWSFYWCWLKLYWWERSGLMNVFDDWKDKAALAKNVGVLRRLLVQHHLQNFSLGKRRKGGPDLVTSDLIGEWNKMELNIWRESLWSFVFQQVVLHMKSVVKRRNIKIIIILMCYRVRIM